MKKSAFRAGSQDSGGSWLLLGFGLMIAMTLAALPNAALGALGPLIVEELNLSAGKLGLAVGSFSLTSAFLSPLGGWLVDRMPLNRVTPLFILLSVVGVVLISVSWTYSVLLVASALGGFGQALSNPATNRIIATDQRTSWHGRITGTKQSGIPLSYAVAAMSLIGGAGLVGWRWALAILALVLSAIAVHSIRLSTGGREPERSSDSGPLYVPAKASSAPYLWGLAIASAAMGLITGPFMSFLSYFAESQLGWSIALGAAVVGLVGVLGVLSRIGWGYVADGMKDPEGLLPLLSGGSVLATLMAGSAPILGSFALWGAAIVAGLTMSAWSGISMLLAIKGDRAAVGRTTGLLVLAFLLGFAVGPIVVGWSVDTTGSFLPAGVFMLASGLIAAASSIYVTREGVKGVTA